MWSCDLLVDWRSTEARKYSFPLHISTGVHSARKYWILQWVVAWVQNTNLIPNTFMTMTTAEEGNHFYFGPQTGSKSPESLVSRSRELHTVYKETISPLRSISSMGGNLKTQNIVICTEEWVSDEAKLDPQRAWQWIAIMKIYQRIIPVYDCGDQLFNNILKSAIRR